MLTFKIYEWDIMHMCVCEYCVCTLVRTYDNKRNMYVQVGNVQIKKEEENQCVTKWIKIEKHKELEKDCKVMKENKINSIKFNGWQWINELKV